MDYVLTILKRELKREKYFGRSFVMMAQKKQIREANKNMVQDRIPQLEKAIEILSMVNSRSVDGPRKLPTVNNRQSTNQLSIDYGLKDYGLKTTRNPKPVTRNQP